MKKMIRIFAAITLVTTLYGCSSSSESASETAEPVADLTAEEVEDLLPDYGDDMESTISIDEFEKLDQAEIEELITGGSKFLRIPNSSSSDNVTFNNDHSMYFNSGKSYCWTIVGSELRIGALSGSCKISRGYGISYDIYHLSKNAYIFRLMVDGTKTLSEPQAELWVGVTDDNVTYETN